MQENIKFLTTQLITYIGNKRALIKNIQVEVEKILIKLNKKKCVCLDLFSGSGVVARMLKQYSQTLIANDLELYSKIINECYLTNKDEFLKKEYLAYKKAIQNSYKKQKISGIITQNYAPNDDENIQKGERVFYSKKNALLIDSYRFYIDEIIKEDEMKKFFLAPLITQASICVNTSGVFKGFYKDKNTGIGCFGGSGKHALKRILGEIKLNEPIFSNFNADIKIYQNDAVLLAKELKNIDIAYLDPPYNEHPYGSNYFMLNLILKNRIDTAISKISGITKDWNRSVFNKSALALCKMQEIISAINAKFVIVSYNSEGFISFDSMQNMLKKYGKVETIALNYNVFRGSRNLGNRNIHILEYLFVLEKT